MMSARPLSLTIVAVQGYFYDWRDNCLFEKINFELLLQAREAAGREPSPSAGVIAAIRRS
jgi:hypothetical protein